MTLERLGKRGTGTLYVDGEAVGNGHITQTEAFLFSADETMDVGNEFWPARHLRLRPARVLGLRELGRDRRRADDHSHMISPEGRLNMAMAIQ